MNKERFITLIERLEKAIKFCDDYQKVLGIEYFEHPLYGLLEDTIYEEFNEVFTPIEVEWINWWVFERRGNSLLKAYNSSKEEIDTVEKLYYEIIDNKLYNENKK